MSFREFGSGSYFDSSSRFGYSSAQVQSVDVQLGCLMCKGEVKVKCRDWDSVESLQQEAEGLAPVVTAGQRGGPSPCGIAAVDGVCRFDEGIELCKQMIAEGDVPGVELS